MNKKTPLEREIAQKKHDIALLKIEKQYLTRKLHLARRYEGKL